MRIIAGRFKSRKINSDACVYKSANGYRPTTDRARETLFNVLENKFGFEGTRALDLFAGTGSLGFEALSRGATSCVFVDRSFRNLSLIKKTAVELGSENEIEFVKSEALAYLNSCDKFPEKFDIIFADPPYNYKEYDLLMDKLNNLSFKIFVLEHSHNLTDKPARSGGIECIEIINKPVGISKFKIFIR